MRTRPLRRFASPLVVIAACSSHASAPKKAPETARVDADGPAGPFTEFRDGVCRILPDCRPPPGEHYNPCNPPPPERVIDCTPALLPTQPPDTTVVTHADGTCWVACTAATCDSDAPLRVRCSDPGAAAPTYAVNVVIPTQREFVENDYHVTRGDDLICTGHDGARTYPNVPCPEEIAPHVAAGVIPVSSSAHSQCYYGKYVVACPATTWHVWH